MNYLLKTFGCQMNYADSEKINMILLQGGLRKVLECAEADIIVLNTCSVRQKGEDRVYGYIREARALAKEQGKNLIVGVTGCMIRKTGLHKKFYESERKRKATKNIERMQNENSLFNSDDKIFGVTDTIDFTMRIEDVHYLTKILSIITGEEIGNDSKWNDYLQVKQSQDNPGSANIIIQTGCDNFCSFCIVPYTRGREISRPQEEILKEIKECVQNGTKEITLLGQNVNSYGKETKKKLWNSEEFKWNTSLDASSIKGGKEEKTPFRELLEGVNTIQGLDRIRFTSSNPHDMTHDILSAHFELPKMCHYLHFALQSGSNELLKIMNRKHTFEDFRLQVEYLRSRDPLFGISTDIIVGFPGETEEQFQETIRAFEICEFDFAFIARYSPRRGTRATDTLGDDISMNEKARRWDILNTLLYKSVRKRNELMLGRTEEILIIGEEKDEQLVGRTRNFKEVYIPYDKKIQAGELVTVKITEMDRWVLKGEQI
ncbi:MAG: MiaB/RimO family radical SAM methylthiotransferase [Candidatus Gracilibacteria bacterium]|nr:MiaB/RimO family radical SAM methylthiotransferase [Candidatus Gracilibacteria bacterium]